MRKLVLLLLLTVIAPQAFPAEPVTVEQLEQVLTEAQAKKDVQVARKPSGLELTERLSGVRLSRWEAQSAGPKSLQTLVALADLSAFLDLPATEIPATGTPDLDAQRRMIALAADYVAKTIHQLRANPSRYPRQFGFLVLWNRIAENSLWSGCAPFPVYRAHARVDALFVSRGKNFGKSVSNR